MFILNELLYRLIFYYSVLFLLMILFPTIFKHTTFFGLPLVLYWFLGYCFWELLPVSNVHFQYLKYNKKTELSIDHSRRIIIIKEGDDVYSFRYDQIKIIHLALMDAIFEGQTMGWLTGNRYHYALI